jgi:hypothetical protein
MEFVVRNGSGAELGRMTTTNFLGVQRAQFDVPEEQLYVLELTSDPSGWQLCPNEGRTRQITQADFRLGQVTESFHFTKGCSVVPPTATAPAQTPVPTVPGQTPMPTRVQPGPGDDDDDDDDDGGTTRGGPFGQIRGVAFIDLNQDGKIGPGEPGLNDVKVNLGGGGLEIHQITPGSGSFNFPGLGPGSYDLFINPGPEWRITTPSKYTVSVNGNDVAGIDFGLIRVGEPMPQTGAAAPRTARQLLIPAPGAGIRLPDTGFTTSQAAPIVGLLAAVLGSLALVGFSSERRQRRG